MIRAATLADIPRIFAIRDSVDENRLSHPAAVTAHDAAWLVDNGPIWVWQEPDGSLSGFSAGDPRDGTIWALFVAPGCEGRGIGRALLGAACDRLRETGHRTARLSTEAGTRAERHYHADGWTEVGRNDKGQIVFQKPL